MEMKAWFEPLVAKKEPNQCKRASKSFVSNFPLDVCVACKRPVKVWNLISRQSSATGVAVFPPTTGLHQATSCIKESKSDE